MRIAILGCGAMGTVLGAYLTKNGCPVDLIDANEAHIRALQAHGAKVIGKEEFTVPVHALLPEEMTGKYHLVFLLTKTTSNHEALTKLLPHLYRSSIVCTLQNGVPEPFVAEYVGKERTVGGAVQWGATYIEPGVSKLTTNIRVKAERNRPLFDIGEISGRTTKRIREVADVLGYMGLAEIVSNLMDARWRKLVINCCGSGMSAALGSPFGGCLERPRAMRVMGRIGREVALAAKAGGYDLGQRYFETLLDPIAAAKYFTKVYTPSPEGKASMLQDLEAGRKTEVDMINGYVSETAKKHGIATPNCDAVIRVVHGIENGELPLSPENLQYFPYEEGDEEAL